MKNIKSKYIIYPATVLLMIWIPTIRYYVSTPWINACVLDYVEQIDEWNYKWTMYDIDWIKHIEANNSDLNEWLEEYKIWEANWCLMVSDNMFNDLNNTFYCTVTYMIKKLPVNEKYKEPLWILKGE